MEKSEKEKLMKQLQVDYPHHFFTFLKHSSNWREVNVLGMMRENKVKLETTLDQIDMLANNEPGLSLKSTKKLRYYHKILARRKKKAVINRTVNIKKDPGAEANLFYIIDNLAHQKKRGSISGINNGNSLNKSKTHKIENSNTKGQTPNSTGNHFRSNASTRDNTVIMKNSNSDFFLTVSNFNSKDKEKMTDRIGFSTLLSNNASLCTILQKQDTINSKISKDTSVNNSIKPIKKKSKSTLDIFSINKKYLPKFMVFYKNEFDTINTNNNKDRGDQRQTIEKNLIENRLRRDVAKVKSNSNSINVNPHSLENFQRRSLFSPQSYIKPTKTNINTNNRLSITQPVNDVVNSKNPQNQKKTSQLNNQTKKKPILDFAKPPDLLNSIRDMRKEIDKKGVFVHMKKGLKFVSSDYGNIFSTSQLFSHLNTNTSYKLKSYLQDKYDAKFNNEEVFDDKDLANNNSKQEFINRVAYKVEHSNKNNKPIKNEENIYNSMARTNHLLAKGHIKLKRTYYSLSQEKRNVYNKHKIEK